jgi:hypothetical protein
MPQLTKFQLYHGGQFYCWRKMVKNTDKLYHIMYQVHLPTSRVKNTKNQIKSNLDKYTGVTGEKSQKVLAKLDINFTVITNTYAGENGEKH